MTAGLVLYPCGEWLRFCHTGHRLHPGCLSALPVRRFRPYFLRAVGRAWAERRA